MARDWGAAPARGASVKRVRQPGLLNPSRLFSTRGAESVSHQSESVAAVTDETTDLDLGRVVSWVAGESEDDFVALSIDHCVALGSEGTFVAGWLFSSDDQIDRFELRAEGSEPLDPRSEGEPVLRGDVLEALAPEGGENLRSPDIGFELFLPSESPMAELRLTCAGRFGTRIFRITPAADEAAVAALIDGHAELVRRHLPAAAKLDLEHLWHRALPGYESSEPSETSSEETENRALQEASTSSPVAVLTPGDPVYWSLESKDPSFAALAIDHCVKVGDHGALVVGWCLRAGKAVDFGLSLRWGEGSAVDPAEDEHWANDRPDVLQGFEARLQEHGLASADVLGFRLMVPGADDGTSRLTITVDEDGPGRSFAMAGSSGVEQIATCATQHWDFVSREVGPLVAPDELSAEWWTALVHVAPSLEAVDADTIVAVDRCIWVPGGACAIAGWFVHKAGEPARLYACTGQGKAVDVSERMIRTTRDDVHASHHEELDLRNREHGFVATLEGLELEENEILLGLAIGESEILGRAVLGPVERSGQALRDVEHLLELVPLGHPDLRGVMDRVGPAVEKIWDARPRYRGSTDTLDFGSVPDQPKLSIIVPIYGRWDFIEYQLALFANDPQMVEHELIYVIDDPAIFESVQLHMRSIEPLFEVPFRLHFEHENLGFAGANNAGARIARGELMLLLNSDVMPAAVGWSERLIESFSQLDTPGAAGARLLYHDGSIQHRGIRFERAPAFGGMWANIHPGKGLPVSSDPAGGPVEVECVTAAFMAVPRELYLEVGGLDEGYIRGDFEDSDLCLRLRQEGHKIYYLPDLELFHLERQSQGMADAESLRAKITLYNCWRHTRRWDDRIAEIAEAATR